MYVLNANHISKSYKTAGETIRILQNVNLQVMKGEMVATYSNRHGFVWKSISRKVQKRSNNSKYGYYRPYYI